MKELITFGKGQMNVLGKDGGAKYIKTCVDLWVRDYGEKLVSKVKAELLKHWKTL